MASRKAAGKSKSAEQTVDLSTLILDPTNSCIHDERNLDVIAGSIQSVGAGRSVLMDGDGIIRAGNGTVQGAQRAGLKNARIVETDGTELIVVKRTDLRGAQAVAAGVADNRASDLHSYDADVLRDQLIEIESELPDINLDAIGLAPEEIEELLAGVNAASGDAGEPDAAETEPTGTGDGVSEPYEPGEKRLKGLGGLLQKLAVYHDRTEHAGSDYGKALKQAYDETSGLVVARDQNHKDDLVKAGFAKSRVVVLSSDRWLKTKSQALLFEPVALFELLADAARRIHELESRLESQ